MGFGFVLRWCSFCTLGFERLEYMEYFLGKRNCSRLPPLEMDIHFLHLADVDGRLVQSKTLDFPLGLIVVEQAVDRSADRPS